ncbi:hypothetical protein DPMN_029536 [Dreissena polymorpha]|uniref:Uncharacterized protein n=1 Tax=Dreissena polymorpha TaxID=45954 RepID=A0A9D4LZE4_DREPO|nr:hypothetical protein DPMN_029536 [Dreissena polymorpha]
MFEDLREISSVNLVDTDEQHKQTRGPERLKFHEDRKINVASRVLTRKNVPPLWPDIVGTNLLTKFHDDRKINVISREKCPTPVVAMIFNQPASFLNSSNVLLGLNLLTEFHDDRTINVAYRVKMPLGSHVFQANVTIVELIQDINKANLLTIFHEDWTKNVASRVLTRNNAPPHGGHVFQPTCILFKLVQDIIGINLLTKFHEDWTIHIASREKNAPPLGSHVFQAKVTIFELIQDIIGTNLLSKFHEYRKINVASRVLTRKYAPPPGGHVFQPTGIIFELVQDIIRMNLLTKKKCPAPWQPCFSSKHWTINVASRELTGQMLTPHNAQRTTHDGQKAITKAHHEHAGED